MYLISKGRCAVLAVIDLALHQEHGPVGLPGMSERTGLSLSYLENIFRKLRHHGLVEPIRGAHGGFLLTLPIADVTVADIFLAVDETCATPGCGAKGDVLRPAQGRKAAHDAYQLWAVWNQHVADYLGSMSIQDLTDQHRVSGKGKPARNLSA